MKGPSSCRLSLYTLPSRTHSQSAGMSKSEVCAFTTRIGSKALAISSSLTPISTLVAAATNMFGELPIQNATSTVPMSSMKV